LLTLVPDDNIELHLAALKKNECTCAEIEDKWKKTSSFRLKEMKTAKKASIILGKNGINFVLL